MEIAAVVTTVGRALLKDDEEGAQKTVEELAEIINADFPRHAVKNKKRVARRVGFQGKQ